MREDFGKKNRKSVHYFREENLENIKELRKEKAFKLFLLALFLTFISVVLYPVAKQNQEYIVVLFFSIIFIWIVEVKISSTFLAEHDPEYEQEEFNRDFCNKKEYIIPWLKIVVLFYSYLAILVAIFLWLVFN